MLDLIFAVLGICLLLVIVVPGVYNYVKSMRENVREKDAKNAFFQHALLCGRAGAGHPFIKVYWRFQGPLIPLQHTCIDAMP